MSTIPFNKPYLTGKETHYIYEAVHSGKISGNGMFTQKCQKFFEEKYGFKVHTANIAEVKRNLDLPMYDAPNAVEELKRPYKPAPEYKVEAIKDALRHFKVID